MDINNRLFVNFRLYNHWYINFIPFSVNISVDTALPISILFKFKCIVANVDYTFFNTLR
jgi:hypothetical protein